jgi:hypothetical protein
MLRSPSFRSTAATLCAFLLAACGDTSAPIRPEFSVTISPATQTATRTATGATTSYSVTTAMVAGAAEQISLALSGLPAGVTGSFNPSVLNGAGSSTLTLTVASTAVAGTTTFTVTGSAASGTHTATAALGICIPGPVTLAVTQTNSYACHDGYRGTFTVTNGTCAAIEVSQVSLTGTVTVATSSPNCTGAGTSNYSLSPAVTIGPGLSALALDLTGGHFCCTSSPCPNPFACDESFGYQATTSAGVVTAPAQSAHIDLGGCTNEVCK